MARRPLLVFVHIDDRREYLNFLVSCRAHAARRRLWCNLRLRRSAGHFFPVQISTVGIGRESGAGVAFLTALTDLSGKEQLERERRFAEEKL